jgi:hypothetical protein
MRFARQRHRHRTHARLTAALIALVAVLTLTSTASAGTPKEGSYGTQLGSHSMLYLNSAPAQQEAMFIAASDAGVRYLRLDITMAVTFGPSGTEDYTALRRVDALAARYGVRVLGVLTGPTWWLTDCPPGTTYDRLETCPLGAGNESAWASMVAKTVRNAPHIRYASQVAFIQRLVPDMIRGGADVMFLTFRDGPEFGPSSPFASEGIVRWPTIVDGRAVYKPAFAALVRLAAGKLPRATRHVLGPIAGGSRPGRNLRSRT